MPKSWDDSSNRQLLLTIIDQGKLTPKWTDVAGQMGEGYTAESVRWTDEMDKKLLVTALEIAGGPKDFHAVAETFGKDGPTWNACRQHYQKLRNQTLGKAKAGGDGEGASEESKAPKSPGNKRKKAETGDDDTKKPAAKGKKAGAAKVTKPRVRKPKIDVSPGGSPSKKMKVENEGEGTDEGPEEEVEQEEST